jgi:hypothetical protein
MDDIDILIQKYGVENLIASIMQRQSFAESQQKKRKKGRPKSEFNKLWDLKYVFLKFQSKSPLDSQTYIAERLLSFVKQYRMWEKRSDLYGKQLMDNKDLYSYVSWIGKDLDAKTIVNRICALNAEQRDYAHLFVDDVFNTLDFSVHPPGWKEGDDLLDL